MQGTSRQAPRHTDRPIIAVMVDAYLSGGRPSTERFTWPGWTVDLATTTTRDRDMLQQHQTVRGNDSIVAEHQYAKIDGVMVDGYSASAIVQVYDALNAENQTRYAAFPVGRMAAIECLA